MKQPSPSNNLKEAIKTILIKNAIWGEGGIGVEKAAAQSLNLILDTILAKLGDDEEGAGDVDNSVFYTNLERRQVRTMLEGLKNG